MSTIGPKTEKLLYQEFTRQVDNCTGAFDRGLKMCITGCHQSGHWSDSLAMDESAFRTLLRDKIDALDVDQARREVEPFVKQPEALVIWSREFFHDVGKRIRVV